MKNKTKQDKKWIVPTSAETQNREEKTVVSSNNFRDASGDKPLQHSRVLKWNFIGTNNALFSFTEL